MTCKMMRICAFASLLSTMAGITAWLIAGPGAKAQTPQQSSDIIFSVGVLTKIDVTQVLRVPRCSSAETTCREFTRLCRGDYLQ